MYLYQQEFHLHNFYQFHNIFVILMEISQYI